MTEHARKATIFRMQLPDRECPSGKAAHALLRAQGYVVDDQLLTTRAQVDAFKQEQDVPTTPQVFIGGARIGGLDALRKHFGVDADQAQSLSYRPVAMLFAVAALLAIVVTWLVEASVLSGRTLPAFIAIAMVLLGLQKLQDIASFAGMFAGYDLLARRVPVYGHVYPFIETGAGLLMLAGVLTWVAAPLALIAASIGAVSVFKAVYIEKRALVCACVGGDSRVPLGFVSLLENLMMIGMAVWMLVW